MNRIDTATRAETVGSLLRAPDVLEAATVPQPERDAAQTALLDQAALGAIGVQEKAGLDVITDGEVRRRAWAETPYYLDCFERAVGTSGLNWRVGDAEGGHGRDGNLQVKYDAVVRRVATAARVGDRSADYAFLAEHATTRTKYTLAAPSYHRRHWSEERSHDAYDNCEDFLTEIRDYLRGVVERVVALGCDYVQLDAPNYGSMCDPDTRERMVGQGRDPETELAFDIELDNSLVAGLGPVTSALHICRGNAPGGRWHSIGGYGAISSIVFPRLAFDRVLLEYDSDRAGTFAPLADLPAGTVAVLGLLSTKVPELEDDTLLRARIAEAEKVKAHDELALSTQCGFASAGGGYPLGEADQQRKLETVARLAHQLW